MLIDNISEVEWTAQHLLQDFKLQGPLIQLLSEEFSTSNANLIVIQGSFDPPLVSHEELIHKAIKVYRKLFTSNKLVLLLLFSLSHVDKEIDIQKNSLLGYRVLMVTELLRSVCSEKEIPFMIGISNVGRYYELTEGIHKKFPNLKSINYIMGTDVFEKIFNPKYYAKPLVEVLEDIFRSNFIVAGRGTTFSEEKFEMFLASLKIPSEFLNQIYFINLSNKLRYESSTNIRKQLSVDHTSKIASVPQNVMAFLRKYHLYSKNPEIFIPEFIIQVTTKEAINARLKQSDCLKIIQEFLKDLEHNKELFNRFMAEFQNKNYLIIKERIQNWLN